MIDEQQARKLIQQLHEEQWLNEQQIRESEERTFTLRQRQADLVAELRELRARRRQAIALRLADAESADRHPRHLGCSFEVHDPADAAFIWGFLNRKREVHADAQG